MPAMLEHFLQKGHYYRPWIDATWCWDHVQSELVIQTFSKLEATRPSSHHKLVFFSAVSPIVFKEWLRWEQSTLHLWDPAVGLSGNLFHIPIIHYNLELNGSLSFDLQSPTYPFNTGGLAYNLSIPGTKSLFSKVDVLEAPESTMNTILSSQLSRPVGSICIPAMGLTLPYKPTSLIQMSL